MAAGAGDSAAAAAPAAAAVRFTPLLGVHGRGPLAYLLELDGFTFLLDCGWNDAFDPALLAPLVAALPRVDAGAWCCRRLHVGLLGCHHAAAGSGYAYEHANVAPRVCVMPTVLPSHSDPCYLGALPYLVGSAAMLNPPRSPPSIH